MHQLPSPDMFNGKSRSMLQGSDEKQLNNISVVVKEHLAGLSESGHYFASYGTAIMRMLDSDQVQRFAHNPAKVACEASEFAVYEHVSLHMRKVPLTSLPNKIHVFLRPSHCYYANKR